MPRYERVTKYIPLLEGISESDAHGLIYDDFMPACYDHDAIDRSYLDTLERYGISSYRHINIESLDLETTRASLTWLLRSDRACHGFSEPLYDAWKDGCLLRLLRRIAELDGTYERPNVVTFYHEYEKDGYLSNWFNAGFEFAGYTFPTGEHWMMWQKARVFGDWDVADELLTLPSSQQGAVKALGKQVKGYSDDVWDAVNQQLMRVGLRQKFVQNTRLYNDLLSTGSAALGEAAGAKDAKWGVGFDKHSPKLADPANWYGRNLLGITLMQVRSDLRALCAFKRGPVWDLEVLRHSQLWRMNLLELSRVPATRPIALAYATIVAQHSAGHFHSARDVLRQVRASIADIDESMHLNMGGGLPIAGWHELLDELSLRVTIGQV